MTSAKSETREENTPEKRLQDMALHTSKLQSYNMTARKSTTKPQTALTNPKLAAEALVVVGAGAGLCYAALSAITEYNDNTLSVRFYCCPLARVHSSHLIPLQPSNDIMQVKHAAVERVQ